MMPKHRDSAIMPGYDLRSWTNASGNKLITEPTCIVAHYMDEQWRPWTFEKTKALVESISV